MKIRMTNDWILVLPKDAERPRISKAGIDMPRGSESMEPHYGEVIEVGPGGTLEDGTRGRMCVLPGDRVFYIAVGAWPILHMGEGHMIMHDLNVVAIEDDREPAALIVSEQEHTAECPEHGPGCQLFVATADTRPGGYCKQSAKWYPDEELKGAGSGL